MKLPSDLQRFQELTLIVATDEQEAKFWIAGGDAIEALDPIGLPREKESDREGAFHAQTGDAHMGSDLSDKHDTPRKKHFTKMVTDRIAALIRSHHSEHIQIVSPPEMLHLIIDGLPKDIQPRVSVTLDKDLMKFELQEMLQRLASTD